MQFKVMNGQVFQPARSLYKIRHNPAFSFLISPYILVYFWFFKQNFKNFMFFVDKLQTRHV